MNKLEPCPFCGNPQLKRIRYIVGTNRIHPKGDMFSIVCDCGCKFEMYQDELFDEVESLRDATGRYEDLISDDDLWDVLFSKWNWRFENKLKESVRRHKEALDRLAENDKTSGKEVRI